MMLVGGSGEHSRLVCDERAAMIRVSNLFEVWKE